MTVVLEGNDPRELFTHLLLYGSAALCEQAGLEDLTLSWTQGMSPRPMLGAMGLDEQRLGELVQHHARSHAEGSWLALGQPAEPSRGLLSPRVKTPADRAAWLALQEARQAALEDLTVERRRLDLRLLAALGEPASWRQRRGDPVPDEGASRLDMQPRNQGSEIVGNRLRPLATAVARRTPEQVVSGLLGRTVLDDLGKGKSDSRGAVNFRPLGPTDSVQAWVALWGLSQTVLAQQVDRPSRTASHVPRGSSGSLAPRAGTFVLPVWHGEWRAARLRALLRSAALHRVGLAAIEGLDLPGEAEVWLTRRRVTSLFIFPVATLGSTSAPERRALGGVLHRLGG
jgi:CRISPR-associated protein Csb3